MTGINQRGRYGRYIQIILTLIDLIILNIAFFITVSLCPEFIAVRTRTVWLLANLAYIPAALLLSHIQTARTIGMEHVLLNAIRSVFLQAPIFICALYFLGINTIPWQAFVEFYGIMFILLPTWWAISRMIIKHYRSNGRNFARVVIVGTNPMAARLYENITTDIGFGYQVVGFFDRHPSPDLPAELYKGSIDNLESFIEQNGVDEIFCALPADSECDTDIQRALNIAESHVTQFYYVPQIARFLARDCDMEVLGSIPIMSMRHQPLMHLSNRLIKRTFDIAVSSIFLIFSPIIFIPVALAIKISSPGPIFFKQKRTGYRGREFYCLKFRTMRVNSNADTQQATKNDPRKTRLGNILRKTSIDELPQFINVLKGDMSIVGPRPHMLSHTEQYRRLINRYMARHYIKPGITGWAQVNGYRGQTDELWMMERRVEHDVWYIEHWSTMLDIKIIFRTILNAIQGEKNAF